MGIHAQCRRTSKCHTILCVWRTPTNCFGVKVGRTRFDPAIQWTTKAYHTPQRFQHNTDQTTKPLLSQDNSHSNSSKLPITDTANIRRNNSNDSTNYADTTRSRTNLGRKQWLLAYNNEGYLVRVHKTRRKALFLPYKTCPIPVDKLENYRRTIVRRPDKNNEDFEEQFQSMSNKQQKRVLEGQAWTGETWFRLKQGTKVPTTTAVATEKNDKQTTDIKQDPTSSSSKQQEDKRQTTFTPNT